MCLINVDPKSIYFNVIISSTKCCSVLPAARTAIRHGEACEAWCRWGASGSPRNVSTVNETVVCCWLASCGWLWTKSYFRREILKHVGSGFPLRAFALEPAVCRVILSKHVLLTWLNTVRSESVQWNECAKDCSKAPSDQSTLKWDTSSTRSKPCDYCWYPSNSPPYCQQRSRSSLHWQACSSMLLTHLSTQPLPFWHPLTCPSQASRTLETRAL